MALATDAKPGVRPTDRQWAVVSDVEAGNDTLVGLETGAGKSLCYLYRGLQRRERTAIMGPLTATNADQVTKLNTRSRQHEGYDVANALGVAGEGDPLDALRLFLLGDVELLYFTPESYMRYAPSLRWLAARGGGLGLLAMDEAAVLLTWEFRESHGRVAALNALLPASVPLMALTGSLTPEMAAESVPAACGLRRERLKLHIERRHRANLELSVAVGATQAQLEAALGGLSLPTDEFEAFVRVEARRRAVQGAAAAVGAACVCACGHMHVCICACIHTYIHTCIHTYMHAHIHTSHTYITYAYAYAYTYVCMHAMLHAYMHACMHAYMHAYMHACMHTYIHT